MSGKSRLECSAGPARPSGPVRRALAMSLLTIARSFRRRGSHRGLPRSLLTTAAEFRRRDGQKGQPHAITDDRRRLGIPRLPLPSLLFSDMERPGEPPTATAHQRPATARPRDRATARPREPRLRGRRRCARSRPRHAGRARPARSRAARPPRGSRPRRRRRSAARWPGSDSSCTRARPASVSSQRDASASAAVARPCAAVGGDDPDPQPRREVVPVDLVDVDLTAALVRCPTSRGAPRSARRRRRRRARRRRARSGGRARRRSAAPGAERPGELAIVLVGDEDLRDVALGGRAQRDRPIGERYVEGGEGRHVRG